MTTAEILRKQMTDSCPFTREEFIAAVSKAILTNGSFSFSINGRSDRAYSLYGGASIPVKHLELATGWAREEGFRVKKFTNYYGVPWYEITF